MITLRQLRYLQALQEHQNFTKAAEAVAISQSALSQQIKELELSLGIEVLNRVGKKFTFTRAGLDIVERAQDILGRVQDLQQIAKSAQETPQEMAVGVIPTVAPYLIPHAVPLLRRSMRQTQLRFREAQTEVLLDDLDAGRIDVAILALPTATSLDQEVLFLDHFLLAGQVDGISEKRATEISPDQLLLLDEGHCLTGQVLDACQIQTGAEVDLRAASISTLCRLAAEGMGLTLVPEIALQSEQRAVPHLSITRFKDETPLRTIAIVRRNIGDRPVWFNDLAVAFKQAGHLAKGEK